jgi:regulation of enolase protein 1 (concanavalin A-like superfamily)
MANSGEQDVDIGRRATLGGLAGGGVVLATGGARAAAPSAWEAGTWLNAPKVHRILAGDVLEVVTDKGTDFWRETHYGFTRDSGHFLGIAAPASFTCQLRVRGKFEQLYDQAGIMVRVDERRWVKAGIELSDGRAMLSSVLTDGRSDWATGPYGADASDFWMRATVDNGVLRLQVSRDGKYWPLVRLCPFPVASKYLVGPMTCTPEREGLKVRFSDWKLGSVLGKELHDLS